MKQVARGARHRRLLRKRLTGRKTIRQPTVHALKLRELRELRKRWNYSVGESSRAGMFRIMVYD
jgi:hypothetical protein